MISRIGKVFALLSDQERRQLWWLLPLLVGLTLVEVIGITSVMPFLALIASPSSIDTNAILRWLYDSLGFQSYSVFLIFSGIAALTLFTLSNALAMLTNWLLLRFS